MLILGEGQKGLKEYRGVRNIKLTLQYDGTNYSGWQIQKTEKTIQSLIEDAIFSVTEERVKVIGAGRTDAGVHALEQVAVFKTQSRLEPNVLLRAINANIPHDIMIIGVSECTADFHPRYSAKSKTYSYIISYTGAYPASQGGSVFLRKWSWQIPYKLNCDSMSDASNFLIGKHDFSCFRASGCSSKNPIRTVGKIEISETPSTGFMGFTFGVPVIRISVRADAFLRHMVRNIVGTLVEVGRGKIPPLKIKEILESKDRQASGPTAPACGLFLEKIEY